MRTSGPRRKDQRLLRGPWRGPEAETGPARMRSAPGQLSKDGVSMNFLIVINDSAYGSERAFNVLRLAGSLAKRDGTEVRVFLLGDGVSCAHAGQVVPHSYYHLDRMLTSVANHGGKVGCCGTCLDARGIRDEMLIDAATRSTLGELTDWTLDADRVMVF